ncbi:MAG: FkbM family methyltransferase [Blastocatellia bacterium]|nr:FkbM family methyltransferase [Blastocatellia bacterium]
METKTKILNKIRKVFTFYPLERLLLSFVNGSKDTSYKIKILPGPSLYDYNSIRKETRNGINYELDISCLMQWYLYWGIQDILRHKLYSQIKPGDVVFDVGTNIGDTLLNFAKIVGNEGKVYGFEPDEKTYGKANKNIALNDFQNILLFKLGISDKTESVKLYEVDEHNFGMNRILTEESGKNFNFSIIETISIDAFVVEHGIKRLDFIKIDIEGYEMHAVSGARKTLQTQKPVLFIELGFERLIKNATTPNEVVRILEDANYKVRIADTDIEISNNYDFSFLGSDGVIDIIANFKY